MTLRVLIGTGLAGAWIGQGYGPYAGDEPGLVSVRYKPAGPGVVGDATIVIRKAAGYDIVIKPKMQVYIGDYTAPNWTRRYFGGFVKQTRTKTVKGTNLRDITVECSDLNILFDWLRIGAGGYGVKNVSNYDLDDQIRRICRKVTYDADDVGSSTFDTTTGQALTGTMTGTRKTFMYRAMTLRDMLDDRMAAYQETFPTVKPAYYMGLDQTIGSSFDSSSVVLNTYDEALIGSESVAYTFDTATEWDVFDFTRNIEGIDIQTRVQSSSFLNTTGTYVATELSANSTEYPNDFDQRPFGIAGAASTAWEGPVRQLADNSTTAAVDADAAAAITTKENPREILTLVTRKAQSGADPTGTPIFPRPGQVIQFSDANEALASQRYRVFQVDTTWEYRSPGRMWPTHNLTCGNKWLELGTGDEGTAPVYFPVILDEPTDLSDPPTQVWDQYRGHVDVLFTFTPSISPKVKGYEVYYMNGTYGGMAIVEGRTTDKFDLSMKPGLASTVYMMAIDGKGGRSGPSDTVSFTTISRGTLSDTTYFALETDADPLILYDDTGEERGRIRAAASTKTVYLYATHPSTDINNIKIVTNSGPTIEMYDSAAVGSRGIDYYAGDTVGNASYHRFRKGSLVTQDAALATGATCGFLYIPTCAGVPSGLPTGYTGTVPLVYDTTGNALYVYNGGWKKVGLS